MANTIEKSIEQRYKAQQMKSSLTHINDISGEEEKDHGLRQDETSDCKSKKDDDLQSEFTRLYAPNDRSGAHVSIQSDKIGEILAAQGKLSDDDVENIIKYQEKKDLNFGQAALRLKLVAKADINHALSLQFGYSYNHTKTGISKDLVTANSPFSMVAEEFRSIRSQLLTNWLSPDQKTLMIVSPESGTGSSYVAANLAVSFSQLDRSVLLIDANMRSPRQHIVFDFSNHVGLSMLLAERLTMAELSSLPFNISNYKHLSILGCSAIPPNPSELLSKEIFKIIIRELERSFDLIIIDSPSACFRADISSIASAAKNALIVVKGGQTKIDNSKELISLLSRSGAKIVGGILNQF